jgi:hypothetical protein
MYKWVTDVWVNGEPVSRHFYPIPSPGEPDFYVTAISVDCFSNREARRHYAATQKKPFKHVEKRAHTRRLSELGLLSPKIPEFEHASLWDMYRAIGYDYKKQRYLKEVPCHT